MKNIAIIPARGGSKRIPRKNIRHFYGKPIIAYSIDAALKSELFDEVMVSTDDNEIAEVAIKNGAKVPFMRSKKNSDDYATTVDVLVEVIKEYENIGKIFDNYCCIYPAAPFITVEKLKDSFALMMQKNADSVIPVVKYSYPIQRAFQFTEDCRLEYIWPENVNKRSQDMKPVYHDAGQFYWCKIKSFINTKKIVNNNTLPFVISEKEVQDIDSEHDWEIASLKYKYINHIL